MKPRTWLSSTTHLPVLPVRAQAREATIVVSRSYLLWPLPPGPALGPCLVLLSSGVGKPKRKRTRPWPWRPGVSGSDPLNNNNGSMTHHYFPGFLTNHLLFGSDPETPGNFFSENSTWRTPKLGGAPEPLLLTWSWDWKIQPGGLDPPNVERLHVEKGGRETRGFPSLGWLR